MHSLTQQPFPAQADAARPTLPILPAFAGVALLAVLTACQTTPPANADLDAARSAVAQARANPYVGRAGAVELERAQLALQRAEGSWNTRADNDDVRHLSYIARRRAEAALAVGAQAQADERLQQAGADRERLRLQARTREADLATQRARAAQANAQNAQASAQTAQNQAAQSREQADSARQQASQQSELARQQAERAAALQRDLQDLQAKSTQRGMVVTMGDVLFATGKANLQPGAQRNVEKLANVLKQHPERKVLVEGFTDNVGSDDLNLELSRRRAESFAGALQEAGVPPARIEVRAHGEEMPVADNNTPAGRQQNRRVEILFSDGQGQFAAP